MEAITENALLDALRRACSETDDNALTTQEIADLLGYSRVNAGVRVRALVKAGHAVCVRKMVQDMTGVYRPQPAYRMKA